MFVSDSKQVTVRSCVFQDLPGYSSRALDFYNTEQSIAEDCLFGDNLRHLRALDISKYSKFNIVWNNRFVGVNGSAEVWVFIVDAHDNELYNNVFENPDGRSMQYGVWFYHGGDSYNNTAHDNTMIFEHGSTADYGFFMDGSDEHVCESNKISGSVKLTDGEIDHSC